MLQTVYAFHINAFQCLIYNVWFVYLYAKHVTALVAIGSCNTILLPRLHQHEALHSKPKPHLRQSLSTVNRYLGQ